MDTEVIDLIPCAQKGKRNYICDFDNCKKTFIGSTDIIVHKRSHTGEKPYVCDAANCKKDFARLGDLTRHKRTHTDQKPYVCNCPD